MALFNSIKAGAAAAALAVAMAAGGFAAPAQAASITLNLGTPGGFGFVAPGGVTVHFGDARYYKYCLDDDGIEVRLEHRGYDNVHIIRHNHDDDWNNKVWVVAQDWKGDWYQMRVDRCTHAVDHLHLVHKHNDHNPFDYNHFSFSFTF